MFRISGMSFSTPHRNYLLLESSSQLHILVKISKSSVDHRHIIAYFIQRPRCYWLLIGVSLHILKQKSASVHYSSNGAIHQMDRRTGKILVNIMLDDHSGPLFSL